MEALVWLIIIGVPLFFITCAVVIYRGIARTLDLSGEQRAAAAAAEDEYLSTLTHEERVEYLLRKQADNSNHNLKMVAAAVIATEFIGD